MAILIDPPAWAAHGRLWSHLVSDLSLDELHTFAAAQGVPRRGFERDHYDVPADLYERLVAAGARPVSSRVVVGRLTASGLRKRKRHAMARRAPGNPLLRPRHLEAGDIVAVPATSGVVPEERFQAGVARIESWGLRVRVGDHVLGMHPSLSYLAAGDEERAADFTAAWLDSDAAAVWVARGGYGSQRVIDLLDWRRLREVEPKVLIGFSDVTALHQAVASQLGLASVHGHVVTSLGGATEGSAAALQTQLMDPASVTDLFIGQSVEAVVGGVGEGVLVGGNLAMLCAEIGTAFSRPASGGIAVLEDISEDLYRIDRMLTQLIRVGWFEGVQGVVLGAFTDCGDPVELGDLLDARLAPLQVPIVKGFDLGHTPSSATVPLGVMARLDADAGSLALTGPALT
jgi:muramoyltetrapeptide carboxypeptidase